MASENTFQPHWATPVMFCTVLHTNMKVIVKDECVTTESDLSVM